MRRKTRNRVSVAVAIGAGVLASVISQCTGPNRIKTLSSITGVVIMDSPDPHRRVPVGNASVTVKSGGLSWRSVSEASGRFRMRLDPPVDARDILDLRVEHPDYHAYTKSMPVDERLYVISLSPLHPQPDQLGDSAGTPISNVRIRYTTRITTTSTVGAATRTFDVVNKGNVPCGSHHPCSPDGKWKATIASMSFDAGERRQFRAARVSCMAGPCPFSSIESDQFSRGGRKLTVSVRNWSDRVTYLFEAEVTETMENSMVRHTFPIILGRFMNFTLPIAANGLAIEADVAGVPVIFPMGPRLRLSWAECGANTGPQETRQYRCELKQGFRF